METSLHRQLKTLCAAPGAVLEARRGCYRIDVLNPDELVEIQHGSLAAIRDKTRRLLARDPVRIVKPIVVAKRLISLSERDGAVVSDRSSPKRGALLDIFDELVYFTRVFPHPRLTLHCVLLEVEETRYPGHGRRRRWRERDFQVQDQKITRVLEARRLQTTADLLAILPGLPVAPFDTRELSEAARVPRFVAARIAYCLRNMGAIQQIGKRRNARLYDWAASTPQVDAA